MTTLPGASLITETYHVLLLSRVTYGFRISAFSTGVTSLNRLGPVLTYTDWLPLLEFAYSMMTFTQKNVAEASIVFDRGKGFWKE